MVISFLLQLSLSILNWVSNLLPNASVLPFGVDSVLSTAVGYFRFFAVLIPPLGTLMTAFIIYLGFLLALKVVKLIPVLRNILN